MRAPFRIGGTCIWQLKLCSVCSTALQAGTILIIALGGRLPQILLNARRGNSGELSTSTCALNLAGNLARVMTTLVLTQVCPNTTPRSHLDVCSQSWLSAAWRVLSNQLC